MKVRLKQCLQLLYSILGLALLPLMSHAEELCKGFSLAEKLSPSLSDNEKRLVCGDPSQSSHKSEGWTEIPISQAIYVLRNSLQGRGYLRPTFNVMAGSVIVYPGPIVYVSSVQVDGAPAQFDFTRKRNVVHEPLTSQLLNEAEAWVHQELGHLGYPCSEVKSHGDPMTGVLRIEIKTLKPTYVRSIRIQLVGDFNQSTLNSTLLRRYDAFKPNTLYDANLLGISADRALIDGVVEKTFFTPLCPNEINVVEQQVTWGKPTLLSLGVSLNTEELGVLDASIKRVRIGTNASSATTEVRASAKLQQLDAFFDWQFVSPQSPMLIRPILEARHRNEAPFEFYSERMALSYATRWDLPSIGFGLITGPEFQLYQTSRGTAPKRSYGLGLATELQLISHQYEFNRTPLSGGYRLIFQGKINNKNLASSFGAILLKVKGENIWNIGRYDPPLLLMTLRGAYAITFSAAGSRFPNDLPSDYQHYLGGITNLRGFGRLELPLNPLTGTGGLNSTYLGLEFRSGVFGDALQPMLFADLGALGLDTDSPQFPLYWSPGIGLIWKSPLGSVRSTLAYGFTVNPQPGTAESVSHLQFYLSLGEPL